MIIQNAGGTVILPPNAGRLIPSSNLKDNAFREKARRMGHQATNQPDADSSTVTTAHTSFRLLDLPPEIRSRIYEFAYGEGYTLTIREEHSKEHIFPDDPEYIYGLYFKICAPLNLHHASKQIFEESRFVAGWNADNSGVHLINHVGDSLGGNGDFFNAPLKYDEKYTELRNKVKKITYPDWTVTKFVGRVLLSSELV